MVVDVNLLPVKELYETLQSLCSDIYNGLSLIFPYLPAWVASRRAEGLLRTCKLVQDKLRASGIQPEQVRECALKIGVPLLEAASLEENNELQEIWASLLANAFNPNFREEIRTAYIDIVKNLSPLDVRILVLMRSKGKLDIPKTHKERIYITYTLYANINEIEISLDNLKRLRLIDSLSPVPSMQNEISPQHDNDTLEPSSITVNYSLIAEGAYRLTALGSAFITACSTEL